VEALQAALDTNSWTGWLVSRACSESIVVLLLHLQLLLVGAVLVAAGVWSLFWGVGGSEGAVEALQAALDTNSTAGKGGW
jgi:hypothetical protein